MRWHIHDEATAEVEATATWYEEQRAGLGLDFLHELRAVLAELRAAPTTSSPHQAAPHHVSVRKRRLRRFPYAVVFVERPDQYVVIAVEHLRRRPGYWMRRTRE